MTYLTRKLTILVLLCLTPMVACGNETAFELKTGDVIAFLGGTNLVNLQKDGHFEALLTAAYPETRTRFRDLAWEGDTVEQLGTVIERWREDKFGDLSSQLESLRISVAVVQFGQCEALRSVEGISDFLAAYDDLLTVIQKNNRRVVILSPIPFEATSEPLPNLARRNGDLTKYVTAIEQLAADRECVFVNLFTEFMNRGDGKLTKNGLHVTPSAQRRVALTIAHQLSLPAVNEDRMSLLRDAVVRKHDLWVNYWRPANWKCLYGDDGEREFGKASGDGLTLRQEWQQLPGLIQQSELRIWKLAAPGKEDLTND